MNSKFLTLLLIVLGLLLTALLARNSDLAWLALPFLAYLAVGVWLAPTKEGLRLQATRQAERIIPAHGETDSSAFIATTEVTLTLQNRGSPAPSLSLVDPLQTGMQITAGKPAARLALAAGEEAQICYTFQAGRGVFTWKTLAVIASDPFGLIQTHLELPAAAETQVRPPVRKFRPIRLRPRSTLHSAGAIPARLGGSGTDFWEVREYHPGDPLRRLDWRRTAHDPRRLYTREFEQEEIADIGLILDARSRSDVQMPGDSLFEHSLGAAASLSEVFLRQGNRVSLLVYGEESTSLLPGYGKVQLNRILRHLAQVHPAGGQGSLNSLEYLPIRMFSSRSLIVIISPLSGNDSSLFPRLRAYGYQVLLISPDPLDFARPALDGDPLNRFALRAARLERKLALNKIEQLWIPVIDWRVSQPLAPQVQQALSHIHIQREA